MKVVEKKLMSEHKGEKQQKRTQRNYYVIVPKLCTK